MDFYNVNSGVMSELWKVFNRDQVNVKMSWEEFTKLTYFLNFFGIEKLIISEGTSRHRIL